MKTPCGSVRTLLGANESATGSALLVMPGATAKGSKAAGLDLCRIIYCLEFI